MKGGGVKRTRAWLLTRSSSRCLGPDHHPGVDRASDLAVHGPRLPVDHEDGLVGRGDEVGAEDARAGDRSVRVAPLGRARIHGSADSRDHLHFPVRQVHEQDVLLGGGARVEVVVVSGARGEEGDVADLQGRFDVE